MAHHVSECEARVEDGVHEAAARAVEAEVRCDGASPYVGIDEKHACLGGLGQGCGEVDGRRRLSVCGRRTCQGDDLEAGFDAPLLDEISEHAILLARERRGGDQAHEVLVQLLWVPSREHRLRQRLHDFHRPSIVTSCSLPPPKYTAPWLIRASASSTAAAARQDLHFRPPLSAAGTFHRMLRMTGPFLRA